MLLAGLAELGDHAAREGVAVYLEPLNRYEDHMLNRLDQAVDVCRELGLSSLRVMGDLFHMSIEESDMAAAIRAAAAYLGHIHLADSNRMYPGAGHTDFGPIMAALREIGFAGALAMECATPDPELTLPEGARRLHAFS